MPATLWRYGIHSFLELRRASRLDQMTVRGYVRALMRKISVKRDYCLFIIDLNALCFDHHKPSIYSLHFGDELFL